MKGHVQDGANISFPDNSIFTIRNYNMTQWILWGGWGTTIGPFDGAYELAIEIAKMDGERRKKP